ncbi:MAG: hypothetical protein ACK4N5_26350, partial [Myxococcales bacterium]
MTSAERLLALKNLDRMEVALVQASLKNPQLLDGPSEAAIRTAISVARLHSFVVDRREVRVEASVAPLRDEVFKLLRLGGLAEHGSPTADKLRPVAAIL